jgi:membrane fusion protein (multidrug efflux system)
MIQGFKAMGEPKATVSTVKAASDDWTAELSAVGSLRAVRGVNLSTEVSGLVRSINFTSGDEVKAGATLMRLVDDADLASQRSLEATANLAKITYMRDLKQLEGEAISQSQVDTDLGNLQSALANVSQQAALVAKKTIKAPFDGRLGISTVNPGQYINPGDTIVTLQQLDPIYADFSLPQQALAQLKVGQTVNAVSDSFPGLQFSGTISAISPLVDTNTRNVSVQATLKNPDRKLLPGMFASVKVVSGTPQKFITLPQTAVTYNPYGETVYLVVPRGQETADDPNKPLELRQNEALNKADAEQKARDSGKAAAVAAAPAEAPKQDGPQPLVARQVFIETGATRGDQVAVVKGLKEGDEVVTSGQLKLKNGMLVIVNNSVMPSDDPNPKPLDQ